jgi:hypothetical protein
MYERRASPLASRRTFARRLALNFAAGVAIIVVSLVAGMLGYHFIEGEPWLDAFVDAAMILSGMGPVTTQFKTDGGKLFAGFYALYSGFAVVVATGIVFVPIVHRILHRFHVNPEQRR